LKGKKKTNEPITFFFRTRKKMSMMTKIPVIVKWGKESIELEIHPETDNEDARRLKALLYEKTSVPESRMKILAKTKGLWKGVLKDDTVIPWKNVVPTSTTTPIVLLLMGSAEEIQKPTVPTVFLEDLPPTEVAKHVDPSGLVNLGNTCYLNSVVQCLRGIPEFQTTLQHKQAIAMVRSSTITAPNHPQTSLLLIRALSDTLERLNTSVDPITPGTLVQAVKMTFPQFAQLSPSTGQPMQQDAEEFYSNLVSTLFPPNHNTNSSNNNSNHESDDLFGMQLQETLTCDEEPNEPPVISQDLHRKLVCNIQGGSDQTSTTNVSEISQGIALSLTGKIEKQSALLQRNAVWTRTQRILQLPRILVVQFGRFYWKATPDSQDHAGVKCKVMKPVGFADTLDVYDFCIPRIQTAMRIARQAALAAQEEAMALKLQGKSSSDNNNENSETAAAAAAADVIMEEGDDADDQAELQAALAMSLNTEEEEDSTNTKDPVDFGPGIPKQFQGYYELFAVVTHKGRDADGGHYMAWVKASHNNHQSSSSSAPPPKIADSDILNEDWYVFDDDEVSLCKTEDVLKLKGGGDWHMSYLNFYRVKK
jgi:ubiquitin carboxyl-terminal hydrolase 14